MPTTPEEFDLSSRSGRIAFNAAARLAGQDLRACPQCAQARHHAAFPDSSGYCVDCITANRERKREEKRAAALRAIEQDPEAQLLTPRERLAMAVDIADREYAVELFDRMLSNVDRSLVGHSAEMQYLLRGLIAGSLSLGLDPADPDAPVKVWPILFKRAGVPYDASE